MRNIGLLGIAVCAVVIFFSLPQYKGYWQRIPQFLAAIKPYAVTSTATTMPAATVTQQTTLAPTATLTQTKMPTEYVPQPYRNSPTATITPILHVKTGVDQGNLNLRAGPGLEYKVVTVLPESAELLFVLCEGNWVFVNYKGQFGYVDGHFIDNYPCGE